MTTAVDDTRGEILQALTEVPREIADIVRTMVDDSFTVPYLEVEAKYALESAVRRLTNLELFDSVRLLSSAAVTFEDNVGPLRGLVEQMAAMTRKVSVAVEELQSAVYMAPDG